MLDQEAALDTVDTRIGRDPDLCLHTKYPSVLRTAEPSPSHLSRLSRRRTWQLLPHPQIMTSSGDQGERLVEELRVCATALIRQ